MYIVGIDIGGTFTDLVAINLETQESLVKKTLTTPLDPSVGVMKIFKEMLGTFNKKDISNLTVYSCGPELMLYEIFKICKESNIEFYASLERIMRCGCGLCGLCALDPLGLLVCKDGPIFKLETLEKIQDFGKYQRDFTGKKISLE